MLQWKAVYSMQSWDSPFGASSGIFKIGTKPLVVRQNLRICGKPWWQAKGHPMPVTLLIFFVFEIVSILEAGFEFSWRAAPSIKVKGTPGTQVHTEGNKSSPTLPNIVTPSQPQPAKVLANLCHAEAEVIHSLSSPTMANTVTQAGLSEVFYVSHQSQSNHKLQLCIMPRTSNPNESLPKEFDVYLCFWTPFAPSSIQGIQWVTALEEILIVVHQSMSLIVLTLMLHKFLLKIWRVQNQQKTLVDHNSALIL